MSKRPKVLSYAMLSSDPPLVFFGLRFAAYS